MAASLKLKSTFHRLKSLLQQQRFNTTLVDGGLEAEFLAELGPPMMVAKKTVASGQVDGSKWKKLDSRTLGITMSMISDPSRIILRILQNKGHDAYLVGGCVRDLLLHRIPKDFDVITTANLQEIKKQFHRAYIVGRRFPICMVHVRGSVIEVSSFETVAKGAKEKETVHLSEMPKGYDEKDLRLWNNSLKRDFTVNSLFFDPFAQKIYDYSSGMADLASMKLRTVVPAEMSFQEDRARILRGLRIAARLGLSFAKDTEKAIHTLYDSVTTLDKARLMMEMNYMLSYGAAEASLLLLKRYNLLEVLLPFHAAYLDDRSGATGPVMLMKMFFNLDVVVSCDQPCDSGLWVSLLAFHLALVNNPQDAVVVWAFSSVLYHGKWKEGIKAARELATEHVNYVPEILESSNDMTDEDLTQRVAKFASIVLDSIDALTNSESLKNAMGRYPSAPCSELVFISKNAGKEAADIFHVLVDDSESLRNDAHCNGIDYRLLGKGDIEQTRYVVGKVIMDTMRGGLINYRTKLVTEKKGQLVEVEKSTSTVSELENPKLKDSIKRGLDVSYNQPHQQRHKKQKQNKTIKTALEGKVVKEKLVEILSCQDLAKKKQQLKKVVVKDVKTLLSLQQKVAKKDAMLEIGKLGKAQASDLDMVGVLKSVPQMAKQQEVQAPKERTRVVQRASKTSKQRKKAQARKNIPSSVEKSPNVTEQRKAEAPTEKLNVSRLSNLFKGEEEKDAKPKELIGEEQPSQRTQILSNIFK